MKNQNSESQSATQFAGKGMPALYFAGPLFSDSERTFNEELAVDIERVGYSVFLPQRDGGELRKPAEETLLQSERRRFIFATDYQHVIDCDVLLFVLDGRVPDEGAAMELGLAYAHREAVGRVRKLVGIKTDSRSAFFHSELNPMLSVPLDFIARSHERLMVYLIALYDRLREKPPGS